MGISSVLCGLKLFRQLSNATTYEEWTQLMHDNTSWKCSLAPFEDLSFDAEFTKRVCSHR